MGHGHVKRKILDRTFPLQRLVYFGLLLALPATLALAEESPNLMLAEIYRQGIETRDYLVSEKLDGVRARWNGKQLISRGGHVFATPDWFTKDFPKIPLDGELWIGRGQYEKTASVVRKHQAHEGWRKIRLMIFDLPEHHGPFSERVREMTELVTMVNSPFLAMIDQQTFESETALQKRLEAVVTQGGEGLMLNRKTALYTRGRNHDLLKLKPFDDAEATVIGYRPGKGKYSGHVGALKVQTDEGIVFYIGTGLSDTQRHHPPPLNSRVTFRYQGFTKNRIPRFAVFLHVRNEQPE